jgi:hypothetical protein
VRIAHSPFAACIPANHPEAEIISEGSDVSDNRLDAEKERMPRSPQKVKRFLRSKMATMAALVLMSLFYVIASSWPAAAMTFQTNLSELPLTFPVQSPEVAAYFNQIARPQDIASFPPSVIHLLPQVTAGQKMVGFASWADAERDLETLADQIDIAMYNPEHWEHTPADEQQNLVATAQRAADFAHAHGLRFMFAPDRRFAEAHLSEVAPYADAVLLQGQRIQDDPQAFASWILGMVHTARTSNPEIQIYVQVGATRGTASVMFAAIQTVSNDIDGIAVWSMPRTLHILQEFVTLLRESLPSIEPTPTLTPTVPTEGDPATSTPTPTAALSPSQSSVATSTPDKVTVETPPTPTHAPATVVPTETAVATSTPTPTPIVSPSQSSVAMATPSAMMEETPPISTHAPATLTPVPTDTVPPSQSSEALATAEKVAIEMLPSTAVPPLVSLSPELEQDAQRGTWLERMVTTLFGMVTGLVVGVVIGFLLGFGLGRSRRWG